MILFFCSVLRSLAHLERGREREREGGREREGERERKREVEGEKREGGI